MRVCRKTNRESHLPPSLPEKNGTAKRIEDVHMRSAKVIVLAGQSNAVGVGHVKCLKRSFTDAKIKEYFNGYENIKINYYSHDKKSDGFTITTTNCTELHKDTIGPEVGMAEYLNGKFPDEEYFIVKFAVGGASLRRDFLSPSSGGYYNIKEFKNEYSGFIDAFFTGKPLKAGWCYNGLVSILNDSIGYLKEKGFSPEIIGFCWMQGESDGGSLENVNNYKVYFDNFVNDLKKEFSQYIEKCVFVDAGISEVWNCHREMNAFKENYAKEHSRFIYVDTIENGLTTKYEPIESPDICHYDCESVIKLGRLFAKNIMNQVEI